jgi:iron complex transport system substrate-binding protein
MFKDRAAIIAIGMILALLSAVGCGAPTAGQAQNTPTSYTVTDSKGHVLNLSQKPKRIVSLTLGTDEILLDMISADRIVALTKFAYDPGISNVVEKAGKVSGRIDEVNVETILSFHPDLVIAADVMYQDVYRTLWDMGIPIYVYNNIQGVEDIRKGIASVGQAVGEPAAAEKLMEKMDKTLQEVQEHVREIPETKRRTVVWVSAMGMRGGKGSLFDSMCQQAGVVNGAAAIGLEKNDVLSKENIIKINPDILLMPTWSYQGKVDIGKFRSEVEDDPALQTLKAIRNRRLVAVSDQYLYCSSHYIVDGVKAIAQVAYPQ